MSVRQQKPKLFVFLFSAIVCGGVFPGGLRAEVFVDDSPHEEHAPSAVASDFKSTPAEEVAREVLRLQQQMGGSVVKNRAELQGWDYAPRTPDSLEAPPWPISPPRVEQINASKPIDKPVDKVGELREAAWQLDTTAHRLEKLDLYDQADALRGVASRLRHDARKMKNDKPASYSLPSRVQPVSP